MHVRGTETKTERERDGVNKERERKNDGFGDDRPRFFRF